MASFSESKFESKLKALNPSQQSIQTLSLWLIHHRRHAKHVVKVWVSLLKKAKPTKHLTFIYLANDVIQNSKKKGSEYNEAFIIFLPEALAHCSSIDNSTNTAAIKRITNIWKERKVFPSEFINKLQCSLDGIEYIPEEKKLISPKIDVQELKETKEIEEEDKKRRSSSKNGEEDGEEDEGGEDGGKGDGEAAAADDTKKDEPDEPVVKKRKGPMTLLDEIIVERNGEYNDPPERDELNAAFHKLDEAPTIDANIRERIANFPTSISDSTFIGNIPDGKSCDEILQSIEEAAQLLEEYNDRLSLELLDRRKLSELLYDYIGAQEKSLRLAKSRLKENKDKLDKVDSLRSSMKKHIDNLPNIAITPVVLNLPTPGDLFSLDHASSADLIANLTRKM